MEGAQIASPLMTASIQYVINVVLTLPAIIFLDRWGRRPPLVIGAFMMMTWLFISGKYPGPSYPILIPFPRKTKTGSSMSNRTRDTGALQQHYGQPNTEETQTPQNEDISWIVNNNPAVSKAVVACSYLFVATFATSWGPTSWTYPAEIYPSKIRAKAVSLATATNWFCNMVLAFAVPPLRMCSLLKI